MGRRRNKRPPAEPFEIGIDSLSHDGRGVGRVDGKTVFVHGALPGEQVQAQYLKRKKTFDEATALEVMQASDQRVEPACAHYQICGGCGLQHMRPEAQIAAKQQVLLDNLKHIGKVEAERILPPLTAEPWGYRRKARLGVKDVPAKGRVLVGFRERGSSFVANLEACQVLHPRVGQLLMALSELIGGLSIRAKLPQIEVAMDDERLALVLRVLEPPTEPDRQRLRDFASKHDLTFYLQSGGPDTVAPLDEPVDMHYRLEDFSLDLHFLPTDFTQVNTAINRLMVARALELLEPRAEDEVLDLFCGVGNFTLPLATRSKAVLGLEGDAGLVERAKANAQRNNLPRAEFQVADLYAERVSSPWGDRRFDKALLDPPRSGAQQILKYLPGAGIERLVYVSCYPGTLARDAGELVSEHGYQLRAAGVMDMFPHTAHVESIALFERDR